MLAINWQRGNPGITKARAESPNVTHKYVYSLRPILPFTNTDVSRHILVLDTSVFAKGNMGRREYENLQA
jgi:hypothetical protein